ncbi:MAG: D-alanine--D-alanine ligase [Planctomycetes bacterium GWF2_50_10]|nr:MAG: D-alanine--D-alanine ligase [Planctomycetes bacterium GWF2_50_10]
MLIALTYDLRKDYIAMGFSPEDVAEFDSEETIDAIDNTIRGLGHQTVRVGNGWNLVKMLAGGARWDLVFNIAEGLYGTSREAQVPAICELYGLRYTFSDPLVCSVTLDKSITKRIIRDHGLATPAFAVVSTMADVEKVDLGFPLFAKPLAEGTGKGVTDASRVLDRLQLKNICAELLVKHNQPVLVEEFLPGREFTTAILGTGSDARILGTMEVEIIDKSAGSIYSYTNKEQCESLCRYHYPTTDKLANEAAALALAAHKALGCRDASRADIRCDKTGRPAFMEINPLAGLHPTHSDLPMIATAHNISYASVIGSIIDSACKRKVPTCKHLY